MAVDLTKIEGLAQVLPFEETTLAKRQAYRTDIASIRQEGARRRIGEEKRTAFRKEFDMLGTTIPAQEHNLRRKALKLRQFVGEFEQMYPDYVRSGILPSGQKGIDALRREGKLKSGANKISTEYVENNKAFDIYRDLKNQTIKHKKLEEWKEGRDVDVWDQTLVILPKTSITKWDAVKATMEQSLTDSFKTDTHAVFISTKKAFKEKNRTKAEQFLANHRDYHRYRMSFEASQGNSVALSEEEFDELFTPGTEAYKFHTDKVVNDMVSELDSRADQIETAQFRKIGKAGAGKRKEN